MYTDVKTLAMAPLIIITCSVQTVYIQTQDEIVEVKDYLEYESYFQIVIFPECPNL